MSVCVIGSLNVDLIARVDRLPRPGETVMASGVQRLPGGKGLNQAVAAVRAGAPTAMIGRVGKDENGDWLLAYLSDAGVDLGQISQDATAPTGQACITVSTEGENTIAVIPGANACVQAGDARVQAAPDLRAVLAQLEIPLDAVQAAFAAAPAGCLKILNAAPALAEGHTLFPICDIVVVNETELAAYAGLAQAPSGAAAVQAAAGMLRLRPDQTLVITLGGEGVLAMHDGDVIQIPGRAVEVVDTVGAGDCFCGVMAAALSERLPIGQALRRANVAAALAVGRSGAASSMPTRAEIDAALTP